VILKRLVLIAAATSLGGAASGQTAAFDAFRQVCAGPATDFAAVRAAADSHGWTTTDTTADANMPGVVIGEQMTRATSVDKTGLVLSAWHGTKGAVKISDCTVHVAKADFSALTHEVAGWLAFPAAETSAKRVAYRFTADGDHLKPLTPADFDAAAGAAGLQILSVSGDQNGAVLDLMMIKK
jgi:hypothetical protein